MKKETRDRKIQEYIASLPEVVQHEKGVVLYEMSNKWWDINSASLLLSKLQLGYSIESACLAIGKVNDARYIRYKMQTSDSFREVIDLQKSSITTKALENVINLQTQAENENVRLSSLNSY